MYKANVIEGMNPFYLHIFKYQSRPYQRGFKEKGSRRNVDFGSAENNAERQSFCYSIVYEARTSKYVQ